MKKFTLVVCLGCLLAGRSPAQDVLVYGPLPSGELMWYSGFAGLNITVASAGSWSAMTTAQFSAYDLIWIGGIGDVGTGGAGYVALDATKAVWTPAITGRALVTAVHVSSTVHPITGDMDFVDDVVGWLLGSGGGTSLFAGQDVGTVGLGFLSELGISGCASIDCFNDDVVIVTAPSHPAMAGSTSVSLSNWDQSVHNNIIGYPPDWDLLATGPAGKFLVIAQDFAPELTTVCLPCAPVGAPYLHFIGATSGLAPLMWSVVAPGVLPPGLMLDAMTGELSGTLALPGSYAFTVRVADGTVPPRLSELAFTLEDCQAVCAVPQCGDCDLDRQVTILDALMAARYGVGLVIFPTQVQFDSCNVLGARAPDPAASVSVVDALGIARALIGLEVLDCCSGTTTAKQELTLGCGEVVCDRFTAGGGGGDLSDYDTTHYYALPAAPPGRWFRVSVSATDGGDLDLYAGAPGTLLGDESSLNYPYSDTTAGVVATLEIDGSTLPFAAGDYVGQPLALAVKSVLAGSYSLTIECICDPIDITATGTYSGSTAGLPDTSAAPCGSGGRPELAFIYTTALTANLTISTDHPGTLADTVIYVSGNGCVEPVGVFACDDDSGSGSTSLLQLAWLPPGTHTIVVEAGAGGVFELTVMETAPMGCPQVNGTIPPLGPFPYNIMGDTTLGMRTVDFSCQGGDHDDVYEFTPGVSGVYRLDTCGSPGNTVLEVRAGECMTGTLVGCNDDAPAAAGCGQDSWLEVALQAGTLYTVAVAHVIGLIGAYTLTVELIAPCAATVDDTLTGLPLPLSYNGNTAGADSSFLAGCGAAAGGPDHILLYVPSTSGTYAFDTCGSLFDTILEVFQGDCVAAASSIGCNDDGASCAPQSQLSVALVAGQVYWVRVSGAGGAAGAYSLNAVALPTIIPWEDPSTGHFQAFFPGPFDEAQTSVFLPFSFPFWSAPGVMSSTTTIGMSSNCAVRMNAGATPGATQTPLWTYASPVSTRATVHAHGANCLPGNGWRQALATRAIFTWDAMLYSGSAPGGYAVQVHLLPNGDFQIRQVTQTVDVARTITIGFSDGSPVNNSSPGATGIDWDTFPINVPTLLGFVDLGSSEAGGMATGVVIYFQFDPAGYIATRLQ